MQLRLNVHYHNAKFEISFSPKSQGGTEKEGGGREREGQRWREGGTAMERGSCSNRERGGWGEGAMERRRESDGKRKR